MTCFYATIGLFLPSCMCNLVTTGKGFELGQRIPFHLIVQSWRRLEAVVDLPATDAAWQRVETLLQLYRFHLHLPSGLRGLARAPATISNVLISAAKQSYSQPALCLLCTFLGAMHHLCDQQTHAKACARGLSSWHDACKLGSGLVWFSRDTRPLCEGWTLTCALKHVNFDGGASKEKRKVSFLVALSRARRPRSSKRDRRPAATGF